MRLSDAMAMGWMIRKPWGFHEIVKVGYCALQSAGAAIGGDGWGDWPGFNDTTRLTLPCQCKSGDIVMHAGMESKKFEDLRWERWQCCIIHMFNHHVATIGDWTPDRLCDWVRSVEPAEDEIAAIEPELTLAEEFATIT
jgi:hypothetical protein